MNSCIAAVLILLALVVVYTDFKWRKIKNWTALSVLVVGGMGHLLEGNLLGLGWGAVTMLLTFLILFPLHLAGGLGAGDVKYAAAAALWLGPSGLLEGVLVASLLWILASGVYLLSKGRLSDYLLSMFVRLGLGLRAFLAHDEESLFMPYGVFLATGFIWVYAKGVFL